VLLFIESFPIMRISKLFRALAIIFAVGATCVAVLVSAAFFGWIKVYVPRCRQKAEQRWAMIGRPMPEFEKQLKSVAENDSLRALTQDLQPFGIKSLYKARNGEQNPNSINVPKQVTDVIDPSNSPRADEVDLVGHDFSYLDQHAADLDRLYQGLLERQPPVWNFVPQDGMTLRVPSYLAARYISQLIWVDALRKLERSNQKEAADAVAAGLKMTSNIGEQPILVSQMIRVAIDGLYAQLIARLPEDPEALKNFSSEVEAKREMWRASVQTEVWAIMRVVDYANSKPDEFNTLYTNSSPLQKARISLAQSVLKADCNLLVMAGADQIRVTEQVKVFAATDLGVKKMNEIYSRYAPVLTACHSFSDMFRPNWSRSWVRLNATLLLREQAEIIRFARAQVQSGESGKVAELESVVIPGAKWQVGSDANTDSVSLKLTPTPAWASNCEVIGENFFLLPLDGSKSWKFRPRLLAAAGDDRHSR
jgi:hypothetical protein